MGYGAVTWTQQSRCVYLNGGAYGYMPRLRVDAHTLQMSKRATSSKPRMQAELQWKVFHVLNETSL